MSLFLWYEREMSGGPIVPKEKETCEKVIQVCNSYLSSLVYDKLWG